MQQALTRTTIRYAAVDMGMLTSCPGANVLAAALIMLLIDKAAGKLNQFVSQIYSSHLNNNFASPCNPDPAKAWQLTCPRLQCYKGIARMLACRL